MKTFFKCSFLLPFFALTLLTFSAIGQDRPAMKDVYTPAVPTGPTTIVEFEEATHDFGTIKEGEIVTHVFTFTNTGDEVLFLTNVKGSCGCTIEFNVNHYSAETYYATIQIGEQQLPAPCFLVYR